ncbi:OmpA family protein, partial [Pseudomonas sp. NPDC086278]|uniref:OmpA family protein n=1 Tax=Pseudomonas sp. NPDC086278 TaxID=3390646 RepID=UPI003D078AA4
TVVTEHLTYPGLISVARMLGIKLIGVAMDDEGDERGTREYNMALGERRAKAVQRYLVLQGVSPAQLELVSYGKERPVATGHDEQSWAQNRRVELRK